MLLAHKRIVIIDGLNPTASTKSVTNITGGEIASTWENYHLQAAFQTIPTVSSSFLGPNLGTASSAVLPPKD